MGTNYTAHRYTDDKTLLEFLKRLANATEYNSYDMSNVISNYWKQEALAWLTFYEDQAKADALAVLAKIEPKVL